ncbi:MAG: endonuclease/exonuclease/phosphatase family protein, partial [Myxococcota bacterium]
MQKLKTLTAALSLLAVSTVAMRANANTDYSLRIGTYNTFFLHVPVENHPVYTAADVDEGSRRLAHRIIKSGYDVIVLQELTMSQAIDNLVEELRDVYPYYAHSFRDDGHEVQATAGLAVFSKLPFVPIPSVYAHDDKYIIGFDGQSEICGDLYESTFPRSALCSTYVAFDDFEECHHYDCWADKGVAYVRVANPDTGRLHSVFFTHMQAAYSDKHGHEGDLEDRCSGFKDRISQLGTIKDFIELGTQTVGSFPIRLQEEDVFVLGDINIDGDFSAPYSTDACEQNIFEWMAHFDTDVTYGQTLENSGFFANTLHDTWMFEHPLHDTWGNTLAPNDYGRTGGLGRPVDGPGADNLAKRLDYILSSTKQHGDPLCNQHPHLAFNLLDGDPVFPTGGANPPGGRGGLSDGLASPSGTVYSSDHLGVNANYNALASHCSPLLPVTAAGLYGATVYGARMFEDYELGITSEGDNDYGNRGQHVAGHLKYPGSVQWYYLDSAGSYRIGLNSNALNTGNYRFQVYASRNLSVPVQAFSEEYDSWVASNDQTNTFIQGKRYILSEGPYYIKVFNRVHDHRSTAAASSGNYDISVERLGCTDRSVDACPLNSSEAQEHRFPTEPISELEDALYFEFEVEQLTVPSTQAITVDVFGYEYKGLTVQVVPPAPDPASPVTIGGQFMENTGSVQSECPQVPARSPNEPL